MMQCELCEDAARLYCESDRASLCWECDAKVHGANFLVGRHSRRLLCRRCQSPTPWRADGARLGSTISMCERCCLEGSLEKGHGVGDGRIRSDEEVNLEAEQQRRTADEDEEDDEDEEEDEDEEDDKEEGEIQVVPWTLTPPPPASSSSSDGEESMRTGNSGGFLKRTRERADLLCTYQVSGERSPCYGWWKEFGADRLGLLLQDDPTTSSSLQNRRLLPEYESASFAHCELWPYSGDREGSETRPSTALDVRVHGDNSAVGVVSDGHCGTPI